MNPRGRDIHPIELRFCSDAEPEQTLLTHKSNKDVIQNLHTKSLRGTHRIYRAHCIQSSLKLPELFKLAIKLHNHAVKTLTRTTNTKHAKTFGKSSNGGLGGEATKWAAYRRARRKPGRITDNPLYPPWFGKGQCVTIRHAPLKTKEKHSLQLRFRSQLLSATLQTPASTFWRVSFAYVVFFSLVNGDQEDS
eukprot:1145768-Pelagomonas_calceolata.AAC.2